MRTREGSVATPADGTYKTYYWAWKGGPPLRGKPGTPEFIASYNAAIATKVTPPSGLLIQLLQDYRQATTSAAVETAPGTTTSNRSNASSVIWATFHCRHSPTAAPVACSWSGATSWH
jgi:hypothetical protein